MSNEEFRGRGIRVDAPLAMRQWRWRAASGINLLGGRTIRPSRMDGPPPGRPAQVNTTTAAPFVDERWQRRRLM